MELEKFYYDNKIVKQFAYATMLWGIVGMLVGLVIALQLAFPFFNFDFQFTTFGSNIAYTTGNVGINTTAPSFKLYY